MEYKRLGDYIREVNVRNSELKVTNLLGLSVSKEFMPSIANTIGTDMSSYKIVERGQFVYIADTSRRGDKIAIALLNKYDNAIVSQAYTVFEVNDKEALLPEYLMMWFRRPEFDRYARFHSHGSAREVFDWDELCNVMLPIPSIVRQREIVEEYETLSRRIRLNEQMIANLEETAQALYRKMFVDWVDMEHLPEGWKFATLADICEINTDNISPKNKQKMRYLDSGSVTNNVFDSYQILDPNVDEIPSRAKRKVRNGDIVYSTVRPNLLHYGIINDKNVDDIVVSTAFAVIRSTDINFSNELLYLILTDTKNTEALQGIAEMSKATYPSITPDSIMEIKFALPNFFEAACEELNEQLIAINKAAYMHKQENSKLTELQSLLLAKMGK